MDAINATQAHRAVSMESDNGARRLRITWSDGRQSAFPYIWLRHCLYHPAAGRENQEPDQACLLTEDPAIPRIKEVRSTEGSVEIEWSHDATKTVHSLDWLRDNCISPEARAERRRLPRLWGKREANDFPWFTFERLEDPEHRLALFVQVRDYGLALVRGVPVESGQVREVARWFGPLRTTHFGDLFDVRSKPEDQLGTGANIGGTQANAQAPHTDETWRHSPPGISFFHCLKPDQAGRGASVYIDGIAAAERLRSSNPEAFSLLTAVPVLWAAERNPQERFRARGRAIATDIDGIIRGVRVSDRTLPPLDLPEDLIEPIYAALAAFKVELYDYDHALERVLQAGECSVFDNHRVLHTRRSFDKQSGERWLQQVSVDREEFHSQLRQLAQVQGLTADAWFEQDGGALAQSLMLAH